MKWEKELKMIEGLGKLYPRFDWCDHRFVMNYDSCSTLYQRAFWVYKLCKHHLNRRLFSLEDFIIENNGLAWVWYENHFGIWEKELKIIEGLGRLYPEFSSEDWLDTIKYAQHLGDNYNTSYWVYMLCKYHLNQQIPNLENFIKRHSSKVWRRYTEHFGIEE